MFGFQQRTNMETNKSGDWLEAIAISNYKTMWLAHGSQVIDHKTRNKGKGGGSSGGSNIVRASTR
jgi:hypothetical protein